MNRLLLFILVGSLLTLAGCDDPVFSPKPRSFPRVVYPEKTYQGFYENFCHFSFEYPTYTQILQDTAFFEGTPPHDCWFDLYYPAFDGRVHFTYVPLGKGGENLDKLRQEAFNMADWHNKRANYIDELVIQTEHGVGGMAFDIDGPAASPFQFFLTDSTENYVRGALYFNTQVRVDSMAPIVDFVRTDILHLIETFQWQK
ncbi:MAG: hypothetical protein DA408_10740 [Bacteroidetes bacterium]|nr:MAG: hypothetical protein C7N36_07855 [Bacteroidota bacterium]PTM12431.1 MAG: hypothetical protein DA408_10740 [Bacteroidota bacterium]